MNEQQLNELLDDHHWLMNYSHLLKERSDVLPAWALIRQWRILAEWSIVIDTSQRILDQYNSELAGMDEPEHGIIVLGD